MRIINEKPLSAGFTLAPDLAVLIVAWFQRANRGNTRTLTLSINAGAKEKSSARLYYCPIRGSMTTRTQGRRGF